MSDILDLAAAYMREPERFFGLFIVDLPDLERALARARAEPSNRGRYTAPDLAQAYTMATGRQADGPEFEAWRRRMGDWVTSWVDPLAAPRLIAGDEQSTVPPDIVTELVAFAKAGNREDFDFLAGSAGIPREQHEEMWSGCRHRLGLEAEATAPARPVPDSPPAPPSADPSASASGPPLRS